MCILLLGYCIAAVVDCRYVDGTMQVTTAQSHHAETKTHHCSSSSRRSMPGSTGRP
jgi:hypothetical protein